MSSEFPVILPSEPGLGDDDGLSSSLAFLEWFDTMFLIDDSASMAPYWSDVRDLLAAITPICASYDEDGVDLFFVNHRAKGYLPGLSSVKKSGYNNVGQMQPGGASASDTVVSIFGAIKPKGKCQLGARLKKILGSYMAKMEAEEERAPLNIIVITAGLLDDDIKGVLVATAKQLDALRAPEHQVGIQLLQMGNEPQVRQEFEHLDDTVHEEAHTRDIVDTVRWNGTLSGDELLKVVLGAVSKNLDARKSSIVGLETARHRRG